MLSYSLHVIASMPGAASASVRRSARKTSTLTWCRSAVSLSCLFLMTASRMRACARGHGSRLCVRTVLCRSAFSSARHFVGKVSEALRDRKVEQTDRPSRKRGLKARTREVASRT